MTECEIEGLITKWTLYQHTGWYLGETTLDWETSTNKIIFPDDLRLETNTHGH